MQVILYRLYSAIYIDYCSLVWGSCAKENLARITKLQKSAARIILSEPTMTSSNILFQSLGWEEFSTRIHVKRMLMMFKAVNDLAPNYIIDLFTRVADIHDRNTRSAANDNFYIARGNTEIYKKSFSYLAANEWNKLPTEIKCATNLNSSKANVLAMYS